MSWSDWVLANELNLRLGFFVGVFVVIALWEISLPRRRLSIPKAARWGSNLALVVLNSLVLRLLFPAAALGAAVYAQENSWGLFNRIEIPAVLAVVVSVVLLDLVIYLQHVMVHHVPVFWRFHRVHHVDLDYDLTTGTRFHTLEMIFSMLIKFGVIVLLGPPLVAVVIFEVILNVTAMFNHGNIYLPPKIDRVLRLFIVTPDMHRVHHSVHPALTNSNFGFSLPWWDRMFGTYRDQPLESHADMQIGLMAFRNPAQTNRLDGMLLIPFKSG